MIRININIDEARLARLDQLLPRVYDVQNQRSRAIREALDDWMDAMERRERVIQRRERVIQRIAEHSDHRADVARGDREGM